jgi:hydrogenase maturation protease
VTGALVVGLGQRDRGDGGAGLAVAGRVASLGLPGVTVIERADPAALLAEWHGPELVVVADAVRSGQAPGTVQMLHPAHGPLPGWTGSGGSNAFGLADAVELARTLQQLPPCLVVVGVEAEQFRPGEPLSAQVAAAIEPAAQTVASVVRSVRP